jgi:hypothetical protein
MNTSNPSTFKAAFAATLLLATSALLAGCEQGVLVSGASADAPAVPSGSVYFGQEYSAVSVALPADRGANPQAF